MPEMKLPNQFNRNKIAKNIKVFEADKGGGGGSGNIRLVYKIKADPTKEDIKEFVESLPQYKESDYPNIIVVVKATDKTWKWDSLDREWFSSGSDIVHSFSQTVMGILLGKETNGYIYHDPADADGLGKVYGWDTKLDKADIASIVYATDSSKNPITLTYDINATSKTLVQRDANGRLYVGAGTSNSHAVNVSQMNTELGKYLPLDGSKAMTGNLDMNNHIINMKGAKIGNLGDGGDDDAISKGKAKGLFVNKKTTTDVKTYVYGYDNSGEKSIDISTLGKVTDIQEKQSDGTYKSIVDANGIAKFESINKLDKVSTTSTKDQMYIKKADGTQAMADIPAGATYDDTITASSTNAPQSKAVYDFSVAKKTAEASDTKTYVYGYDKSGQKDIDISELGKVKDIQEKQSDGTYKSIIGTDGIAKLDSIDKLNKKTTTDDKVYSYGYDKNDKAKGLEVVDDYTSNSKEKLVSAYLAYDLNSRITNVESIGRSLSGWNCRTGKASTTPPTTPYTYKAGDYYTVQVIDQASDYPDYEATQVYNVGAKCKYDSKYYICKIATTGTFDPTKWDEHTITNYRPYGTEYSETASTVVETEEVAVNDTYRFDGTIWVLFHTTGNYLPAHDGVGTGTTKLENLIVSGDTVLDNLEVHGNVEFGNPISIADALGVDEAVSLRQLNKRILDLSAAPTTTTKGVKGQLAFARDTAKLYHCTAADDITSAYTWEEFTGGGSIVVDGKTIKLNASGQAETSIGGYVIDHYSATQIVATDSSLTEVPGFAGTGFAVASYNPIAVNDVITIKFLPKEGADVIYLNKRKSQHMTYIIGGNNVDFIGTVDTSHGINIGKFVVEGMGTFFGVYKYEGTLEIDATTAKLTVDKLDYSEIEKISAQVVPVDNKTLLLDGNVLKSAVGGWKESGEITITIAYKSGLTEFVGMTGVYVVNGYTGSFLEGDSITANFKYSSTEYVNETANAANYTITIDGKTYDLFGIQFSTLPGMYLGFVDDGKGGKALVVVNQSTATLEVTYASLDASVTRTGEIYHALDGRYLPVDGTSVKLDSNNKLHVDVPTNYLEYIDVEGGQLRVYSSQGVVSYYEPVTGAHDGTNWTNITIGGVSKAIPSGGSGGGYSPDGKTIILDSSNKLSTAAGGWDEATTTQKLVCSASGLTRHASATVIYKINDVSNDIALGDVVNGYIKDEDLGIEVNFDNAEFKNIELKIYGETATYKACVDTTGKIYVLYRVFDETLKEKLCVYDPTSLGITSTTTIKLTADTTTHNYHKIDYNYIPVTGVRSEDYNNIAEIVFGDKSMPVSVVKGNSQRSSSENLHDITVDGFTYDNQHVRDIVETGNPREWEIQMDTDTTKWLLAGKENFIISATMSNANNFSGTIGDKEFGRLVDSFQDLDIILELVGLTITSEHTFTIKLDNLVINSATNDITCYFIHTLDNSAVLKWEFKISGTAVGDDHAITGKGTTL